MLSYPATIPLSSRILNHLAEHIRSYRKQRRSRWWRLEPGRQALLALAHLRKHSGTSGKIENCQRP